MFPSREIVKRVREEYPEGTRVELVRMDDCQAPPIGTKGWIVNTFLDNFFKVIFPILYWCLITK